MSSLDITLRLVTLLLTLWQVTGYWHMYDPKDQADYYEKQARDQRNLIYNRDKHLNILTNKAPVNFSDTQWLLSYDGRPFDLELLLIIFFPALMGLVLGICVNFCLGRSCEPPTEEFKVRRSKVSIIRLQQSQVEQKLAQTNSIGLEWYSKRFAIRANDAYVDIDTIIQKDFDGKSAVRRNPWRFLRQATKWIGWYLRHKRKRSDSTDIPSPEPNEGEVKDRPGSAWSRTDRRSSVWHP